MDIDWTKIPPERLAPLRDFINDLFVAATTGRDYFVLSAISGDNNQDRCYFITNIFNDPKQWRRIVDLFNASQIGAAAELNRIGHEIKAPFLPPPEEPFLPNSGVAEAKPAMVKNPDGTITITGLHT